MMREAPSTRPLLLFVACLIGGCEVDTIPAGLRRTPAGDGPWVRFDLTAQPLPDVPFPNDVMTFADPTSRTGRRVNLSVVASTAMERRMRADLDSMEGWGVSSAITVAFDKPKGAPVGAAIDVEGVMSRMGAEHDPSDDPIYVVNLRTGIPVLIDVGSGYYPVTVRDPARYGPSDPKAGEPNVVFETVEEGAGVSAYRPDLDRDFDGVLDHPNTSPLAASPKTIPGVDDLLTWYERETDTLILRPILPLDEETEYAVVLTDRLRGANGQPVRSPFANIHHPSQIAGVARMRDWLLDGALTRYYGDLAGTGLDHVAFAWTFTTQPTHADLKVLRDGLYGQGPFGRLATAFPTELTLDRVAGTGASPEPPGWETSSDACKRRSSAPFLLRPNDPDVQPALQNILEVAFHLDQGAVKATLASLEHVDHIVLGTYRAPYFLGDPSARDPDARFDLDFRTGRGDVRSLEVPFLLTVPKATSLAKQPFPVSLWDHGARGSKAEALLHAGDFARQGVAIIAYDAPAHGLVLDSNAISATRALFSDRCAAPFLERVAKGRAIDVDGDGRADSGGLFWSAHVFHTRDSLRQGVVDGMQLLRILRSFDGSRSSGAALVAGDFDGDGVPDVGGPSVSYYATGQALGGILSELQGGVDPAITAVAPIAGGGALAEDVTFRTTGMVETATSQVLGPWVFAVPASERPDLSATSPDAPTATRCASANRSLRLLVHDGLRDRELEIACLNPSELATDMTVVVTNVTNRQTRCARTGPDGRFGIAIPTSAGDKLDVQLYNAPDAVSSYGTCKAQEQAPVGRRVQTFEVTGEEPLITPAGGLGLRRQSPELRRFRDLAQAALDSADPIAFAPYYMLKPLLDEKGVAAAPRGLFVVNTIGDTFVPIASGLTVARAAGAVPFLPPSAAARLPEYADYATPREIYDRLGRRAPMRFLVERGVVEGLARLGRTSAGSDCRANDVTPSDTCPATPKLEPPACAQALFDPDWPSEGRLPFDEPHPETPLRLARVATARAVDDSSLARSWEPRLRGAPSGPDEVGWSATERVVGLFNHYLTPDGEHGWGAGNVCRAWDAATYGNALIARYFASGGRDVYFLSHPKTHGCLVDGTCELFKR